MNNFSVFHIFEQFFSLEVDIHNEKKIFPRLFHIFCG